MARDSQVSKAYAADHRMYNKHPELKLASLEECQLFIIKVVTSRRWASYLKEWNVPTHNIMPPTAESKHHGAAMAWRFSNTIDLPKWAWHKTIILHELSHFMPRPRGEGAHGRSFCRWHVRLALDFLGPVLGKELRDDYKAAGAKCTFPRRRRAE